MKSRETSGLEGKQNLGKRLGKGCGKGGGEMRGRGGCEEKVDRERKGTRRECHAFLYREVLFRGPLFKSDNTWMATFFYKSDTSS